MRRLPPNRIQLETQRFETRRANLCTKEVVFHSCNTCFTLMNIIPVAFKTEEIWCWKHEMLGNLLGFIKTVKALFSTCDLSFYSVKNFFPLDFSAHNLISVLPRHSCATLGFSRRERASGIMNLLRNLYYSDFRIGSR